MSNKKVIVTLLVYYYLFFVLMTLALCFLEVTVLFVFEIFPAFPNVGNSVFNLLTGTCTRSLHLLLRMNTEKIIRGNKHRYDFSRISQ